MPLPRKVELKTSADVRAMIERVAPTTDDEGHDFQHGVDIGRPGMCLTPTNEHYRKLK